MKNIYPVNFNGYIPVNFYAKNPSNGKYTPVQKKPDIRKCQGFVVRNLNGTAKNMKNDAFVTFYEKYDNDYRQLRKVKSVYDNSSSSVIMLTGKDAENADLLAHPVGKAKSKALAETGKSLSVESYNECVKYFDNIKNCINTSCKRIKNKNGQNLSLHVFFEPKYNKKNELKGFKFVNAGFKADI